VGRRGLILLGLAWIGAVLGPLVAIWVVAQPRLRSSGAWRAALAFGALGWVLGVWAFLAEPETLTVRHVTIESRAWRGPPVRVGVISDLHIAAPHMNAARVRRVVARMNQEAPDVVVLLGDFAGGHEPLDARPGRQNREIARGIAALSRLHAPHGVKTVLGNHDWWYGGEILEGLLRSAGLQVLANSASRVDRPGGAYWLVGLEDVSSERARPSLTQSMSAMASDEPFIVLSHYPDPWPQVPERATLTIAGHTHCGQVNLPLVGRLVSSSPGGARWPCGLYRAGAKQMFVTGGVGTSVLPVRFGAPPEIVVLTVRSARPG
jgi:predicted MPP superfamily phosphohydrolase